jgi:hypothetical protein
MSSSEPSSRRTKACDCSVIDVDLEQHVVLGVRYASDILQRVVVGVTWRRVHGDVVPVIVWLEVGRNDRPDIGRGGYAATSHAYMPSQRTPLDS